MRSLTSILVLLVITVAAGCSSSPGEGFVRKPTVKAQGSVMYRGQPAEGARVIFVPVEGASPDHPGASGRCGADGGFVLKTYSSGDGISPGIYDIAVVWKPGERDEEGMPKGPDKLKGRYADPSTSGLRRTIPETGGEIEAILLE